MNWTQMSKRGRMSVLPNVYSMEAVTTLTKQLLNNICYKKILMTFENRNMHVFVDTESYNHINEHGLKEIRKNPKLFDHAINEIQILAKEWIQWLKTLEPQTKTNEQLIEIYLKYRQYYQEIYGRYFTIIILEKPLTTHLYEILQKAPKDKRAEYFTLLTSTIEAMHSKKEERDRLQLAVKIKKYNNNDFLQNPEINAWIDHHTEKYFWLTRDYEDPHLTKEDFIKKIRETLERTDLESAAHKVLHEEEEHHKKIIQTETELQLTTEEKEFFRIMRAGIFLKELRKSIVSESLIHFDKILEEICKRTNITIKLTRMLLPHDLPYLLLDNKPYTEILQKRFDKSVYLIEDGKYIACTGKEAEKWFNELIKIDNDIKLIQGIAASAGIAQGPARIILHPSDFHKVNEGDIMVTVQAVPSFLQTIKKCKALVADGGTGITSHPATLAREAKIPCVINAKIATEIIKDGDFIEVDGNKGIITRLNKNTQKENSQNTIEDFSCKNLICLNDEPNMNLFTIGPHIQGMHRKTIKNYIGTNMTFLAAEYKNKRMWFYTIKEEYEEYGKKAFEKVQQDKYFINSLFEEIKLCAKKTEKIGEKLKKKQWKLSNKEQCSAFNELYENHAQACMLGYVTVAVELENSLLTNKAFEEINNAIQRTSAKRNANEYFAILTSVIEDTVVRKEYFALLELVKQIQINKISKKEQEQQLAQIHNSFCWANFGYNGPIKTIQEYEIELAELLKIDAEKELNIIEEEKQELIKKQEQYVTELQLTNEQKYWIDCVKNTTLTKILRKDFMAYSCFLFHRLVEEARIKNNFTVDELQFLTPYEIKNMLNDLSIPNKTELQERIKYCVYLYNNEKEKILYNTEAKEFLKKHVLEEKIEQISELKGMAAYLGKVQGRAIIVNTKEDINKIKEGDILISYATSPDILPAMKKAAAFVTDHGGATCHAAIVAREMKKPCIIGTKYATKVINDNDIIEVDAYTGIVKKIKQKQENEWMLAEDIPDVDLFFMQICFSCFANEFVWPTGKAYNKVLTIFKGYHLWFYYDKNDSYEVAEHLVKRFKNEPSFAVLVNNQIVKEADKLRTFAEKLPYDSLQNLSSSELWNLYQQHDTIHTEYYQWTWIPVAIDMFHNNLTNSLKNYLKEKNISEEKANEYFIILTQPTEKSLIIQEQEEFLKIALDIAKNKKLNEIFKEFYIQFQQKEAI
ncbi:MAG: PEP-utilizing enzyme, partial [Candidatus Woesearchaeota archaeon]